MDQTSQVVQAVAAMIGLLGVEPGSVSIEAVQQSPGVTQIRVTATSVVLGRIIGVQGRTARALRTLLEAVSCHGDHRYMLDLGQRP